MITSSFITANPMTPSFEVFEIEAISEAQKEDAGFYFQMTFAGRDLGDPEGPFPSMVLATNAAQSQFVD